jgi:hypothetical protein
MGDQKKNAEDMLYILLDIYRKEFGGKKNVDIKYHDLSFVD